MMKINFVRVICLIFLMFFAFNCFAEKNNSVNSVFSINLPDNMKLTWQNKNAEKNIYQFIFQTPPLGDYSPQQIRITAVGQSPINIAEYNDWETNALGANIAMFTDAYHLDLSKQGNVLAQKPEKIKLGEQTFTAATMTFGTMQTYFLVTITKSSTYNIILVSIDKNLIVRKLKMQKLLNTIKSIEYFGTKKYS